MKIIETISVIREVERCAERRCDLCGVQAEDGANWSDNSHNVADTEVQVKVKHRSGESYGDDGGWGVEYDIDLCPACFKDKLVPWLISQGAKIEPKKWDY